MKLNLYQQKFYRQRGTINFQLTYPQIFVDIHLDKQKKLEKKRIIQKK